MAKKLPPYPTYLIIAAATAFFFTLMGTVSGVYRVSVGLTPMQLVLVGTVLELSVFLFEVPTGIVADLYSRRLSLIIGYAIWGLGFVLEGALPLVGTILLAQAVWGLGYTFTSGAQDAWLADEIGEERLTQTYLRGSQLSQLASLAAIGLSVYIATFARGLPLVMGGLGLVGLALFLLLLMPESQFKPIERTERTTFRQMGATFKEGLGIIRGRQVLLIIFAIEIFIGLHSEGIDRLWEAHLLRNFTLPQLGAGWDIVYWFGIIEVTIMLASLLLTELVRRRLTEENEERSLRLLLGFNGLVIAGVLCFALTTSVTIAIASFMALSIFRGTISHQKRLGQQKGWLAHSGHRPLHAGANKRRQPGDQRTADGGGRHAGRFARRLSGCGRPPSADPAPLPEGVAHPHKVYRLIGIRVD